MKTVCVLSFTPDMTAQEAPTCAQARIAQARIALCSQTVLGKVPNSMVIYFLYLKRMMMTAEARKGQGS